MKRFLSFLFAAGVVLAQTPITTPNLGLYLPAHGSYNWDTYYNANWNRLDSATGVASVAIQGAKCDGVTDDTAAIQAAINAVPSSSAAVVMFPQSTNACLITSGLQIANKSGLTLTSPTNTTIRFKAGTVDTLYNTFPNFGRDSIFRITQSTNISITNLTLDGNLPNRTALSGQESQNSDITVSGVSGLLIRNCTLTNGMTDALALVGYGTPQIAINYNVWIENNTITNSRRNNISVVAGHQIHVRNNVVTGAGTLQGTAPKAGIDVEASISPTDIDDVEVVGNTFNNNAADGFHMYTGAGLQMTNVRVIANTANSNATHGFTVDANGSTLGNRQVILQGNTASGNTFNGIYIRGSSTGAAAVDSVQGNVLYNNAGGLTMYTSANLLMSQNVIHDNTNTGISLGSSSNTLPFSTAVLSGNVIYNNATASALTGGQGFAVDAWTNSNASLLILTGNSFFNTSGQTALMRGVYMRGSTANAIDMANTYSNLATDYVPFAGNWVHNTVTGLAVQDPSITAATISAGPNQANNPLTSWKTNAGNNVYTFNSGPTGFNAIQHYRASDGTLMGQFSYAGSNAAGSQWYGLNNISADYLLMNSQTGPLRIGTGTSGRISIEVDNAAGNVAVKSGTNTLYRCTTAGTLPVGALTITAANCGATADTGLRLP